MSIKRGDNIIAGIPVIEGALNTVSTLPVQNKVIAKAVNDLSDRIDLLAPGGVYTKTEVNNLLADKADVATTYTKTEVDNLFATLYPVGSLYLGTQATCPLATIIPGSVWELVAQDRSLQGSSNSHAANTTIEAGLPDHDHKVKYRQNDASGYHADGTWVPHLWTSGYTYRGDTAATKNASESNPIYGNSTTVQPPAYVTNIWRRTQ